MNNEDLSSSTVDAMTNLMMIFDHRDTPTKDEVHEFGNERGYSDYQIDGMMESLLNYGYIHEPIKDHFKMIRKIE